MRDSSTPSLLRRGRGQNSPPPTNTTSSSTTSPGESPGWSHSGDSFSEPRTSTLRDCLTERRTGIRWTNPSARSRSTTWPAARTTCSTGAPVSSTSAATVSTWTQSPRWASVRAAATAWPTSTSPRCPPWSPSARTTSRVSWAQSSTGKSDCSHVQPRLKLRDFQVRLPPQFRQVQAGRVAWGAGHADQEQGETARQQCAGHRHGGPPVSQLGRQRLRDDQHNQEEEIPVPGRHPGALRAGRAQEVQQDQVRGERLRLRHHQEERLLSPRLRQERLLRPQRDGVLQLRGSDHS